jgi:hypothetical protein
MEKEVAKTVGTVSKPESKSEFKVAHWTMINGSGMFHVANSMAIIERQLGIDSIVINCQGTEKDFEPAYDADIHVVHTHFPDVVRKKLTKSLKIVWVGHGSVEHCFQSSVEAGVHNGYGAGDSWALCQYWMQHADALVTFWPRQQAIWQSLCDKNTKVNCVPLGVEKEFWKPMPTQGKYAGNPSLFTAENCHYIKWPLDLLICWPWVYKDIPEAYLHAIYIPNDQHRWYYPLVNRNGARFKTIMSSNIFSAENLRNAFCSVDFFIGLVRYGEANRLALEANACGAKTISYWGNEYSDFWIHEGDQRVMAKELIEILSGKVEPRKKLEVPDIKATGEAMIAIYRGIL